MRSKTMTPHDRELIRDALTSAAHLCLLLDSDTPTGQLQRRCLVDDIRTRRNLRHLQRTCARLARLIDDRPNI